MDGDPTPALTGRRRTRPTSPGCRNPQQPKPGRTPLILAHAAVQTNRATSVLSDLFILRGVPGHIRSDNGPEFVAKAVQRWITAVGAKAAYIAPGSPWENGYVESFNARLRD